MAVTAGNNSTAIIARNLPAKLAQWVPVPVAQELTTELEVAKEVCCRLCLKSASAPVVCVLV